MAVQISTGARDEMCDAFVDFIDVGGPARLLVYEIDTTIPAISAAATGTLLADLAFSATAFDDAGTAGGNGPGEALANAITPDTNVASDGTAGYFRIVNAANSATHAQGTVTAGGGGGDLEFTPTNVFVATGTASITAMTVTVPETC